MRVATRLIGRSDVDCSGLLNKSDRERITVELAVAGLNSANDCEDNAGKDRRGKQNDADDDQP